MRMLAGFSKEGVARHVSHLDLLRSMQRAIRRSGIPVKYSSGFNPHQVIAFASAMSVGMPSGGEWLDIALTEEMKEGDCLERLGSVMPPGIALTELHAVADNYPALMNITAQADYCWRLHTADAAPRDMWVQRAEGISKAPILAEKKSKKGVREVDLREFIVDFALTGVEGETPQTVNFDMTLVHAPEGALNPALLLPALLERWQVTPLDSRVRRNALWAIDGGKKTPLWAMGRPVVDR